jgi:hypothetical protein
MARHHNHLIRNLLTAALTVIAAMHPQAVGHMTQAGTTLLLATVQGVADAATAQPGPAILTAGLIYITHQIRTHRPHPRRAHA